MKISKVSGAKGPSAGRKKEKVSDNSSGFADRLRETHEADEGAHAVENDGVGTIGAVDSVFALQEVPDATDQRSRAMAITYGKDMLDRLDELRVGILNGVFSKSRLAELAQSLRKQRQNSDDAQLNEIIEEIELRAEIEIAKLTRKTF